MKRFIVIEGVDCAGKSTLVQNLSTRLGYTAIKTPSKKYQAKRAEYDYLKVPVDTRFRFYLDGVIDTLPEINNALKFSPGVIVDRYTRSLLTYHSIMNPDSKELYSTEISNANLPTPDLEIICSCNTNTLISRLKQKTKNSDDRNVESNYQLILNIAREMKLNLNRYTKIIDSSENPENTLSHALSSIIN
jgi:thymidylate kinase